MNGRDSADPSPVDATCPTGSPDAAEAPVLDALFGSEARTMGCVPADAAAHGRVGRLWEVGPAFGAGSYWYYPIDDCIAVASFDLRFSRDVSFSSDTVDLFCFGSYGRAVAPYMSEDVDPSERTLLGYAWRGRPFTQTAHADERLDLTSVTLLPRALRSLCLQCRCDPAFMARVITELDGTRDVPGLSAVFDDLRRARPSRTSAHAYYLAKVTEAFTLLLDWGLARRAGEQPELSHADHEALNAARDYLRANATRAVSTSELCDVAYVSASKLARLFRQAEGVTPQEYARGVRMERACDLLEASDASMAEVARELGFSHQGSFLEAFKGRFGVTPREFRARRRRIAAGE